MTAPYTGLRLLLVAHLDESEHAHNALRQRALERLGCGVQLLDPERAGWIERLVRRDIDQRLRSAIDQQPPDLVVVAGQGLVPPDTAADLRRGRPAKWIQLLDDEIGDADRASNEAMAYDHVFVGSSGGITRLERHGIKHAHYLALGCDPSVHKPLRARGVFRANVVFAGAASSRRERLLTELVEFGLAVWGPGWRRTGLKDYCRGELPTHEDFVRAYAGATVAVNIHRSGADDRGGDATGVNRRAFELAAIGVAQVIDGRPDLPQHFEDGSEVLVYTTPEELKGQVKRAVQEDKYRDRLAENARQRALRHHTYMHRMSAMLAVVTGNG
ncbi:MAG TPA: glycosyltransferase [Gemmatimonadales bacterium]|nr:glycosyltransferase [Gemmatimonadales bacterium]